MVQVKDLTQLTLRDLWREVKEEDEWWGDLKAETLRVVKRLLEASMEEELLEQLRAGRYRRTELRRGYRNGYRHRSLLGVKKRLVLCAYGITETGHRELISFRQAPSEGEAQWEAFLRDLYERGLKGQGLQLITTDGCPGLHRGLDTVYPYVPRQRCWAHKLRNVAAKLPRRHQEACLRQAKEIYQAPTPREAVRHFREWAQGWRERAPKAVRCLEQDLEELLTFLDCPLPHWRKVRTTNAIERAFREVRRRTRPMSCFQNAASVDRIIYGVMSHLNTSWKAKPLREFTHNT